MAVVTSFCNIKGECFLIKKDKEDISLKDYFDLRINDLKNYIDTKFENLEKANNLARENLDTRLESMNEFRNSMKDQASTYITRKEIEAITEREQIKTRWVVTEILIIFGIVLSVIVALINFLKI